MKKYLFFILILVFTCCKSKNTNEETTTISEEQTGEGEKITQGPEYDRGLLEIVPRPYNIESYFLLLPQEVLGVGIEERNAILESRDSARITTQGGCYNNLDVLNYEGGYMSYSCHGDGGGEIVEITYWKREDNTHLIAVNKISYGMCCDESYVEFLTFTEDNWEIVTKEVFPDIKLPAFIDVTYLTEEDMDKMAPLLISLPLKGKNIIVKPGGEIGESGYNGDINSIKIESIELVWNNINFINE